MTVLLLLLAAQAWAYTENCNAGNVSVVGTTGITPTLPSNLTNGDLIILSVADAVASTPAITFSGGTGTWNTAMASTTVSGSSRMIIVSHTYQSGDTAPTFVVASGSTTAFIYNACGIMGYTGVDQVGSTATGTSATVNYPTETPSQANDEALFIATMQGSVPTINSTSNPTTCGQTTDQIQEQTKLIAVVSMSTFEDSLGPCSPTALAAQTMTLAATTNTLGVTLLLTPAPLQSSSFISTANPLANVRGAAYFLSGAPSTPIDPAMFYYYDDIWAVYTSWNAVEPNNCDEYSFDYLDNLILLARQNGKRVSLAIKTGYQTPCGVSGAASCSGFTDASGVPAWAFNSTTCDGHHAMVLGTDYIQSVWQKGFGPPEGNADYEFDPVNTHYQAEWDRAIADFGSRWGAVPNVVAVKATSFAAYTVELATNAGTDGTKITCSGTGSQCNAISGDADWPGTGQPVSLNHIILPSASSNNTACSSNPCVFKATTAGNTSASTQPTWSTCTTTCTDGTVTWTNQGAFGASVSDGSQWLALTPAAGGTYSAASFGTGDSTNCTGSSQPFLACDFERGHEHFEASWHAAFPNSALENAVEGTSAPKSTVPTCGGGGGCPTNAGDTFVSDIFAHDKANYSGIMQEENGSLGFGAFYGNCVPIGFFNSTWLSQPQLGVAYQTGSAQANVSGATCNTSPLYSTSATQCLTPSVYGALTQMENPMIEFYVADWDTAGVQPWIKLMHDIVSYGGNGRWIAPVVTSGFSSQLGNSVANPGTFETGHQ